MLIAGVSTAATTEAARQMSKEACGNGIRSSPGSGSRQKVYHCNGYDVHGKGGCGFFVRCTKQVRTMRYC